MRTYQQMLDRLKDYGAARMIYLKELGYIVWHVSTGGNVEMLYIEVSEPRKGYGTQLYRAMAKSLIDTQKATDREVPYHSVFCYRLGRNTEAGKFYESLGFTQVDLGNSIYRDGRTVLMYTRWEDLRKTLGV